MVDKRRKRCPDRMTTRRTDRQTGRQTDRQTGRQADRQTERQTGRQTGRQTDRQTGRQADRSPALLWALGPLPALADPSDGERLTSHTVFTRRSEEYTQHVLY